jgi:hypothetical protein
VQSDVAAEAATHKDYFDGSVLRPEWLRQEKDCHSEQSEESLFDCDAGAKPNKERFFALLRMTII